MSFDLREFQLSFLNSYLEKNRVVGLALRDQGVSRSEYEAWLKDPWFLRAKELIDQEFLERLKAKAYQIALQGENPEFLLKIIERSDPTWDPRLREKAFERGHFSLTASAPPALPPVADPFHGVDTDSQVPTQAPGEADPVLAMPPKEGE